MEIAPDMHGLVKRQAALEDVLKRFRGRRCDFVKADCVRLARADLVALGHQPPQMPCYRTLIGAKRALTKAGFDDLAAMFDSLLPRIPAARLLPGDVVVMLDGEERWGKGAAAVWVGNGKALGFHPGAAGAAILVPNRIEAAWRA